MASAKGLIIGNIIRQGATISSPAFTNFTLNESTDKVEFIIQAPEADTITKLGFRFGVLTGNSPTFRISLQGVTDANPDGTIKQNAGNNCAATFTCTSMTTLTWQWITLDYSYTCTRGENLAIVIEYSSGTIDGSNNASFCVGWDMITSRQGKPYSIQNNAGTRSYFANTPLYGLASATRTYGNVVQSYTNSTFDSNDSPDEIGMAFTLPAGMGDTYKVAGVRFYSSGPAVGTTFKVLLYNDTTVLQEITVDSDSVRSAASGHRIIEIWFSETTLATLNFGTQYIIALQPQETTTALGNNCVILSTSADLDCHPGGTDFYQVTRVDLGSWTHLQDRRPPMELILSEVTEPTVSASGGGGGVGGVFIRRNNTMDLRYATSAAVKFGPFLDVSGAPLTGLTIQKADVRLTKNGGNMAAANGDQGPADAGAPHDELGCYDGYFSSTDTDTYGRLEVKISKTGAIIWEGNYNVIGQADYDAKYSTTPRAANVTQWLGVTPSNFGEIATSGSVNTLSNKIGAFTATGDNTILGFLKAIASKAANTPSDMGGTYAVSSDSLEAIRDAGADMTDIQNAILGGMVSAFTSAGTLAERIDRIPNFAPGGAGGLPTVDASNYIAGLQGTINTLDSLRPLVSADVLTQVNAALEQAISELSSVPSANPSLRAALMFLYMSLRNQTTTTNGIQTIRNDAGTMITSASLDDNGTTFNKSKFG